MTRIRRAVPQIDSLMVYLNEWKWPYFFALFVIWVVAFCAGYLSAMDTEGEDGAEIPVNMYTLRHY
jgi:hypothetical protein